MEWINSGYSKIENGFNHLSVATLLNICTALNVPVNDILNQKSVLPNATLNYNQKSFDEKMNLYDNTIQQLEEVVTVKQNEIVQLKKIKLQLESNCMNSMS